MKRIDGSARQSASTRLKLPWKTVSDDRGVAERKAGPGGLSPCVRKRRCSGRIASVTLLPAAAPAASGRRPSAVSTSGAAGIACDHRPGNQRAFAHEAGAEPCRRPGIDPLGRPFVLDAPVVHDDAVVGERHRLFLVVGDMDEGGADALLDRLQLVLHLPSQLQVERAERLVEQQHRRLDHQRARQRHALPLAAGKLVRLACRTPRRGRPAPAPRAPSLRASRRRRRACAGRSRHCCRRSYAGTAHSPGTPWWSGASPAASRCSPRRAMNTLPSVGVDEAAEDRQQRRLARAGRAEQHGVAARRDVERHVAQRRHARPKRWVTSRMSTSGSLMPASSGAAAARAGSQARSRRRRPASRRHWSWG